MFQTHLPVKISSYMYIKRVWKQIKAKEELPQSPDSSVNYGCSFLLPHLLKYFIKQIFNIPELVKAI